MERGVLRLSQHIIPCIYAQPRHGVICVRGNRDCRTHVHARYAAQRHIVSISPVPLIDPRSDKRVRPFLFVRRVLHETRMSPSARDSPAVGDCLSVRGYTIPKKSNIGDRVTSHRAIGRNDLEFLCRSSDIMKPLSGNRVSCKT